MSNDRITSRQSGTTQPARTRSAPGDTGGAHPVQTALVIAAVFAVVFAGGLYGFRNAQGPAPKEPARAVPEAPVAPEPRGARMTIDATVLPPDEPIAPSAPTAAPPTPTATPAALAPHSPDVLFARTSPSVVQIVVQDQQGRTVATGSGFLVGTQWLVATNYHVIEKAHSAHIVLPNKTKVPVPGVAAFDKAVDLAIIGVAAPINAQPLDLARDGLPPVGVRVYAIGNPLGLANTLSDGLVSGHRELAPSAIIQTSAPISPGSSGGPLLVADGRVVGVTTAAVVGGQNLNFAVPAAQVARLLRQWETNKKLRQFPIPPQPGADLFVSPDRPNPNPPVARTKVQGSRDDGKFFSAAAFQKVGPTADKLWKEKGTDFVVETVTVPWKGDAERLKALKPDESEKFFRELVEERGREVNLRGVYILVCKNPSCLHVLVSDPSEFPAGFGTKVVNAMADSFRERKFDEGLQKAIDFTIEAKGLGKR